jgi:putative SOS response-associated peptidase YedK
MCGRYATTKSSPDLSQLFAAFDETDGELAPDYNLAPTDPTPIVRISEAHQRRALSVARWGLIPHWADSPRVGARMINARAETAATAKAFASSFEKRRCLVPVDGWFEWLEKKPFYMTLPDGFAFAGLWTENRFGLSCTIVTTAAMGQLTRVHTRMPLLVRPERWEEWLMAPADPDLLTQVDLEYIDEIEIRPVGAAVGNVRNDGPSLIEPLEPETLF